MQDRNGQDFDYLVPGTWYLAPGPGTRHRSRIDAEGRTPSTEDRVWPPENAHTGCTSCIHILTSSVGPYGRTAIDHDASPFPGFPSTRHSSLLRQMLGQKESRPDLGQVVRPQVGGQGLILELEDRPQGGPGCMQGRF